jgi:hypothetical protein
VIKFHALLLMTLFFIGAAIQNSQAGCPMMDSTQQQKMMMDKQCAQMAGADQGKMCCAPMRGCKVCHHPRRVCAMLIGLLALLNLLLTILVILDMTKTKRFNGLWIPLVLIAGIPCTVLYALFRIGDNVKPAEEKK